MRRCLPRLFLGLVVLSAYGTSWAAEPLNSAAIDAIVQESLQTWSVPGAAVAIIRGDEDVYLKGYGLLDIDRKDAVTPDTLFAIASCSKAFTATAIAMLIDDGKMAWDDPVRKHIPSFRLADPLADLDVTLRDLLCHRTGLSRHDLLGHGAPWDRAEIVRRIAFLKPTYSFRSTFQYSNLMYVTAGYAAGRADGSDWETLVRKRIFIPLNMKGANFRVRDAEKAADYARPHIRRDGKAARIGWRVVDNMGPAGSINASVRDLVPWLRFQLGDGTWNGKRLLSAAQLDEMHAPQMILRLEGTEKDVNPETLQKSYGLGWFIQDYRGQLLWSHTGGLEGFRCRIVLVPHARLGVVLLSNSGAGFSRASMPVATTYNIVDQLLGLPKRDWNTFFADQARKEAFQERTVLSQRAAARQTNTKPSLDLSAYAGDYDEPAYGRARVTFENNRLRLNWSSFNTKLAHFHFDTFVIGGDELIGGEEIVFHLGADGAVSTMKFLGVSFKKRRPPE